MARTPVSGAAAFGIHTGPAPPSPPPPRGPSPGNGSAAFGLHPTQTGTPASDAPVSGVTSGPAPSKGGGGLLGFVHEVGNVIGGGSHWIASKADLAAHDIKGIPGGIVKVTGDALHSNWLTAPGGWHGLAQQYEHPFRPVPGDKLATDVQGMVKASGTSLRHPLRDPFATALTVLPIVTAGAGVAARVGYAGEAVSAGEAGSAAKALVSPFHKPPVAPRFVKVPRQLGPRGGGEGPKELTSQPVPIHPSNNAAWRLVQAGYDHVIQRALDTSPESRTAAHAMRRAEGSIKETSRRRAAMRQTQPAMIGRLAAGAGRGKLGVPRPLAEAALRLTTINRPAELAARYHLDRAAAGGADAGEHANWAKVFTAVARRGVVIQDKAGNTIIDAERYPRLAALDKAIAEGQQTVDEIAASHGLASPEQLKAGRDNPGRVYSGARYEAPTPGKLGRPSQTLLKARSNVERLQVLHDRALGRAQEAGAKALGPEDALIGTKLVGPGATQRSAAASAIGGRITGQGRVVGAAGAARAERIGSALSVAKDRLAQLEQSAANRVEPTGMVGGEPGLPGRGYTSYATRAPRASGSPMPGGRGPVVGRVRNPVNRKTFTGAGIEHANIPDNVTRLNREHLHAMLRYVTGDEFRRMAAETGSDSRRSSRDVLIRLPDGPGGKLPADVEQVLGRSHSTVGETDAHTAAIADGLRPWIESLIPDLAHKFSRDKQAAIGANANQVAKARGLEAPGGYRWVDRNVIRSLEQAAQPTGRLGRGVNTVNSAVTAATVYFKIGHLLTRAVTNATANILQGSARPVEIARSFRLFGQLSEADRLRALAASGGHGIAALPHEGTNLVARAASTGANWWARRIDAPFRFNSIAYEARNAGFTTAAEFRGLLDKLENPHTSNMSAAERSKVMGVANRANREAIAYDRLSDFEKTYLARGFWFYPWTKAAVTFTGHTIVEHPYKSAALAAAGVVGREEQQRQLGPVPSFEQGLISLGGDRTTDFSTFTPSATTADVLNAVARPGEISGFLNPVYSAALTATTGVNQYGSKTSTPLGDALSQLFSPTPEAQIASAWMHPSGPTRMFHKTPLSQLARALAGPATPRKINRAALTKAAAREKSGR